MIKNTIMAFALFLMASNAFAISDEELAQVCLQKGIEKVESQAQAWGCEVDTDKIEVQDIDNRWYNPSKYIWYQIVTPCNGYDRIIQLVQYYKGKCL